jgi:hypothetical protein
VSLQKYFSLPSLVIYLFSNPTHKTKARAANKWETTNSNPSGLDQSSYPANQQQVFGFAAHPFTSLSILCKNAGPKPFC